MSLDLSKFKKIKEDGVAAILQHPDGHQIHISKKNLNKKLNKDLSNLPVHFEDGGEVQDPNKPTIIINNGPTAEPQGGIPNYDPNAPMKATPFSPWEMMKLKSESVDPADKIQALQNAADRVKEGQQQDQVYAQELAQKQKQAEAYNQMAGQMGLPQAPVPNIPQNMVPLVQQAAFPQSPNLPSTRIEGGNEDVVGKGPQQPQDPYGTQAYYDNYSKGLSQQKSGLQQEAAALGAQGKAEAEARHNAIVQQEQRAKSFQDNFSSLENERKSFMSDLQNQHIDPKRFLNSMGVGQKISTGIGLILGGMGSGLLRQENPVMRYLNQQISNDIDAQTKELGKSENLLAANMKQFGNLKDATDMTRVMSMDILANQLGEAAAKAQDPIAKARAMKAMGELQQASAPILSQIAMRKTLLSGMQSGKANPGMVIRSIVPEGQQAAAYKELGEAQQLTKFKDNVLGAFQKLNKINTVGNLISSPIQTGRQVDAILAPVLSELSKELAGKFTEFEMENLKSSFPQKGDDTNTIALKNQKLNQLFNQKMNFPILSSYGIMPQESGRYAEGGDKKIKLGPPVAGK